MDQTSLVWRKKIKALEKAKPQMSEYTLMTTTKYIHALDTLYENQEIESNIKITKLKEAEAVVQALRKELLMLNSQLSTMREEKEQYKQELQKAHERPKTKKRRRTY
jgi:predicted RNase H-like nuclease (RuvC/YqgF family)